MEDNCKSIRLMLHESQTTKKNQKKVGDKLEEKTISSFFVRMLVNIILYVVSVASVEWNSINFKQESRNRKRQIRKLR